MVIDMTDDRFKERTVAYGTGPFPVPAMVVPLVRAVAESSPGYVPDEVAAGSDDDVYWWLTGKKPADWNSFVWSTRQMAGTVSLWRTDNGADTFWPDHLAGGPALFVTRLMVHPEHRGVGFGTALLAKATEHAAVSDSRLFLDVFDDLTNAIRLYESNGWSQVGETATPDDRKVLLFAAP